MDFGLRKFDNKHKPSKGKNIVGILSTLFESATGLGDQSRCWFSATAPSAGFDCTQKKIPQTDAEKLIKEFKGLYPEYATITITYGKYIWCRSPSGAPLYGFYFKFAPNPSVSSDYLESEDWIRAMINRITQLTQQTTTCVNHRTTLKTRKRKNN